MKTENKNNNKKNTVTHLDFLMQGFSTSWGRNSMAEALSFKAPYEFCKLANKSLVLAGISKSKQTTPPSAILVTSNFTNFLDIPMQLS